MRDCKSPEDSASPPARRSPNGETVESPSGSHRSSWKSEHEEAAVISMRFDSSELGNTMSEIVAYGTAVVVVPDSGAAQPVE
jgi:hypothetical protein